MLLRYFSIFRHSTLKVPPVDLSRYIKQEKGFEDDCKSISQSLHRYGICVVKDPRCKFEQKQHFLDLMEKYFSDRSLKKDQGNTTIDVGPKNSFWGLLHSGIQKFSPNIQEKAKFLPPNHSLTADEPVPEPTWRFRWQVNSKENVIPLDFQNWQNIMNSWGQNKMECCKTLSQMAALGFGIEKDYFLQSLIHGAGHLSPTGLDLTKMKPGQVMTGFHHDFDLLTIHGKPRFGGLYIWLNTGEKVKVQVPEGHLLLQAGKQLEWMTGGHVKAGWHEVIFTDEVQKQRDEAIQKGRIPWRISSVLFQQIDNNFIMKPHPKFCDENTLKIYPPKKAEDYCREILYSFTGQEV